MAGPRGFFPFRRAYVRGRGESEVGVPSGIHDEGVALRSSSGVKWVLDHNV